jgi:hypothetical protein
LQQQREIELCIGVVRRYPQGAQAFDGGLNASLPVQQVTKVYQASANVGSTRVAARKAASASTLRRSTLSMFPGLNGADASVGSLFIRTR